jgi:COMPASS component SWD3
VSGGVSQFKKGDEFINGSADLLSSPIISIHSKGINDLCWSLLTGLLVSGSDDHTLSLYSVSENVVKSTFTDHHAPVTTVATSPHSTLIASGGYDENVRIFDPNAGIQVAVLPAHADPVTSVAFSEGDGRMLVSGSYDGLTRVWDGRTGKLTKTFIGDTNPAVTSVAVIGNFVYSASLDSKIRVWDLRTEQVVNLFDKHKNENLIIRPVFINNTTIVMGSEDGRVFKYSLSTSEQTDMSIFSEKQPVLNLSIFGGDPVLAANPFNSKSIKFNKL